MINPQSQIKINLSTTLKKHLENRAQRFGMPLAGYVKHLILEDAKEEKYPEYELSERSEKALKKALKNKYKAIRVEDIDEFFKNL